MSPQEEVIYVPLPPDPPPSRRTSSKFPEVEALPGAAAGPSTVGNGNISSKSKDSSKLQVDDSSIYPRRPSDQSNGIGNNSPAGGPAPSNALSVK